jgi:hypothetical protein
MVSILDDGPVNLIRPFEQLGRRMVRSWSPSHVSAALPGQRANHARKVHDEAWRTLFELSRYARDGVLPLYPFKRLEPSERIAPSLIWLIYPRGPASNRSTRGLVELVDGTMIEAVADITEFTKVVRSDHPLLPPMGRPLKYPEYYCAAKAFWDANKGKLKSGAVIEHIRLHKSKLHTSVPEPTRYRMVEKARVDAHKIA